jgi:hypothetical protein
LSRIFDNIDLHLGEHLKKVLTEYDRMDAAVGYFNLRGWQFFAPIIGEKSFSKDVPAARILIGMTGAEPERIIADYLQSSVNGSVDADGIDNTLARERKNQAILKFREQLSRGVLDQGHYEALRTLKQHLQEGRKPISAIVKMSQIQSLLL